MEIASSSITFQPFKNDDIPLNKLPIGKTARIKSLLNSGLSRRRLLDLGLIQNSIISIERISPSGNPIAYNIRGSVIALRNEEARNVVVKTL